MSNSYTSGIALGIFKSINSCSERLSKYLTIDLKVSPWAVTRTFFPDFKSGIITSLKYEISLAGFIWSTSSKRSEVEV